MIYREPIPVFEAHCFLTGLTSGFEDLTAIQRHFSNNADIRAEFSQYYSALLRINETLKNAVTASKYDIDTLYMPLLKKTGDDTDILFTHTIASCFIMEGADAFRCYDDDTVFEIIRKNSENIISIIFDIFFNENGAPSADKPIELPILLESIVNSDYSEQAKLTLVDVAATPLKYAERLIELLKPVMAAFRECEALYAPLVQKYNNIFEEIPTEKEFIQYFCHSSFSDIEFFDIYPIITMPLNRIVSISDSHDGHGSALIGVLSYWISKRLNTRDLESELVVFMDVLSNKNRIRIIKELSMGKKFGRELAEKLHLTNGSISQSLNQLVRAGLIKIEDVGAKVYCSVDKAGARRLVNLIIELFDLDGDQAED